MKRRKLVTSSIVSLFALLSITTAAAAGSDKAALVPKLDFQAARDTDISFRILNYDDSYTWKATTSAGEVIMDRIGNLSIVNLQVGQKATVTVTAAKAGYATGIAKYDGTLGTTTEETIEISKKEIAKPKPKVKPTSKTKSKITVKTKTKSAKKKSSKKK